VDDGAWTYAQLDALANQVAEIVLRESPDRSKPVALLFDQGIGGIASIMGVLKAGRAYCAISPAHPGERHRESLADLQPALLLCAPSRLDAAREIARQGLHCAAIDPSSCAAASAGRTSGARPAASRPSATSGTTGRPKGVMLSHRFLLHRVWLSARMLEIQAGDPMSQVADISFATAASDVFAALLTGATLCPFDARRNSLRQLADWLERERIAILRLPVALFHQFVDALDDTDRFPHVRYLQPAGKLDWTGVDRYRRHFGRECRLVRQLAATETSLLTVMMVGHDTPRIGATVPVGYPVPGKEVWLEGENGARVDGDGVGEIVVRSRYLYSGLWGRPETLLARGDARVHRMGDLGRWLPDGSLEFVGRIDSRVKIRGFTVDLRRGRGRDRRHRPRRRRRGRGDRERVARNATGGLRRAGEPAGDAGRNPRPTERSRAGLHDSFALRGTRRAAADAQRQDRSCRIAKNGTRAPQVRDALCRPADTDRNERLRDLDGRAGDRAYRHR
jgi:non-ribosomal peptide synthetase component F